MGIPQAPGSAKPTKIFTMNPDDSNAAPLTRRSTTPAWSPDGKQIAFASDRDGDSDIYVMDTDPSTDDATQLTSGFTDDVHPDWSPDGTKIAFARWEPLYVHRVQAGWIYVMNSDGSQEKRLPGSRRNRSSHPAWSPNGKRIAFVRYDPPPETDTDIFVMSADGSRQKRLTYNKRLDLAPDWQPIVP